MRAFNIKPGASIWVYKEPVNMGASFPKLTKLLREAKKSDASGDLFLFVNTKRTYLKILFYHKGGMCIFAKRLTEGVFATTKKQSLTFNELDKLVEVVLKGEQGNLKIAA